MTASMPAAMAASTPASGASAESTTARLEPTSQRTMPFAPGSVWRSAPLGRFNTGAKIESQSRRRRKSSCLPCTARVFHGQVDQLPANIVDLLFAHDTAERQRQTAIAQRFRVREAAPPVAKTLHIEGLQMDRHKIGSGRYAAFGE